MPVRQQRCGHLPFVSYFFEVSPPPRLGWCSQPNLIRHLGAARTTSVNLLVEVDIASDLLLLKGSCCCCWGWRWVSCKVVVFVLRSVVVLIKINACKISGRKSRMNRIKRFKRVYGNLIQSSFWGVSG